GPANESDQTLTIIAVDSAIGGSVSLLGSDVIFTPAADFNGPASFRYTLEHNSDAYGVPVPMTSTAIVHFTITEYNDAPTRVNDDLSSVAEDSGARLIPVATLLGNDLRGPANEGGQALSIITVDGASGGTFALSGTDVIFTPAADFNGAASFRYT